MTKKSDHIGISWGLIAGITVILAAAGAGVAWLTTNKLQSNTSTLSTTPQPQVTNETVKPQPSVNQEQPTTEKPIEQETIEVYWLKVEQDKTTLQPVPLTLQKSADKGLMLTQAFKELLTGSTSPANTTTIPSGTKLLGLKVEKDGVHLNLSPDFATGAGSETLIGRLAQVLYTATSLDPQAQVWINVGGKPLEMLGEGDGVMVDQPMTRKLFEENFQL